MSAKVWIIGGYVALVVGGLVLAKVLPDWEMIEIRPENEVAIHRTLMGLLVLYIALAAIPFVPGAEIGFGMLVLFGGKIAPLVYIAMIGALTLAFLAGRFLPARWVSGVFGKLGFHRAEQLVRDCHTLDLAERATFLAEHVPTRVLPMVLRHRHLSLAVLLNLPGNTVLGGGGGIAFAAGASRLYSVTGFLATILVAVAPVPVVFFLTMP